MNISFFKKFLLSLDYFLTYIFGPKLNIFRSWCQFADSFLQLFDSNGFSWILSLSAIMPKCSQSVHGTVYLFSYQNQPYSCYLSLLPGISVIVMIWTTQIQGEKLLWKLMWFRFFPMIIILVIFCFRKIRSTKKEVCMIFSYPNSQPRS